MVITEEVYRGEVSVIGYRSQGEWCTLTNEEKIKWKLNKTYFVRNKYLYLIMSPFDIINFQNQFIFNCKFYIIYSRKIQSKDQLVVV